MDREREGEGAHAMTNPDAASTPPEVLEVGWHNVVLSYAGVAEEYRQMRSAAERVETG